MSKEEALKIVLIDVCCSNGKEFCGVCPLSIFDIDCDEVKCSTEQLLEAVRVVTGMLE